VKRLGLTVFLLIVLGGAAGQTADAKHPRNLFVAKHHMIYTGDFITATVIVGRYYGPNIQAWLVNCSSSEGGHGGWVWRDHTLPYRYADGSYEDKPGGWLQFFRSTFDNNVGWAWQDARHHGMHIDPKARNYYEPLGQAVVAAAMVNAHGNPGTWTGANCSGG
jgi:hypothetical protein